MLADVKALLIEATLVLAEVTEAAAAVVEADAKFYERGRSPYTREEICRLDAAVKAAREWRDSRP